MICSGCNAESYELGLLGHDCQKMTLGGLCECECRRLDLEYEEIPDGPQEQTLLMATADHLTVKSATMETGVPELPYVAAVIFEFGTSESGELVRFDPMTFITDSPDQMRRMGKILRDACNGAANAMEERRRTG